MKVILDTNVVISAIFFGGAPRKIIDFLHDGKFELILSKAIYQEYIEIAERLAFKYKKLDGHMQVLHQLGEIASFVKANHFESQVCEDPDDDIFLEAAVASGATIISSGDKLLLACDGYRGIRVMRPKDLLGLL